MFALWMLIAVAHSENQTRLNISSQECQIYIKKFYTFSTDFPSLIFSGWIETSSLGASDGFSLLLTFYYFDSLNQDQKYYGLVQQDQKLSNETCLDLKLWQFSSDAFNDPQQTTYGCFGRPTIFSDQVCKNSFLDHQLTSHFNSNVRFFQQQYINSLNTTLEWSSAFNLEKNFWGLSYYLVGSNDDLFSFYFYVTITRQPFNYTNPDCTAWCFDNYIRIYFHPFNFFETQNCSLSFQNCTIKYTTTLKWCTDATCSQFITSPKLILNESFYLLISINKAEFKDNYLIDTKAYLQGEALDYEIIPLSVQNSIKGQSIIELQSNIVWSNVRMLVTSYLISSLNTNQTKTYPVNGYIDKIQCIFMNSNSTECPNCDDEQNTNGFARIECKQDYRSACMILVMIAILT